MDTDATVFIVDSDQAVLAGLAAVCKADGLNVQTYRSTLRFLLEYDADQPGCVVLELRMPEMDGMELQEKLTDRQVVIPVIFTGVDLDTPTVVLAMKRGAFDIIEKPFENQVVLGRVREAILQDGRIRQKREDRQRIEIRFAELTKRERQVMDFIVAGKTTKRIAYELAVSTKTIDFHRINLMRKLNINSVAELVRMALTVGKGDSPGNC